MTAEILGERVSYKIGAPGRHLVENSLAVLAAAKLVGADLSRAMIALQRSSSRKAAASAIRSRSPAAPRS